MATPGTSSAAAGSMTSRFVVPLAVVLLSLAIVPAAAGAPCARDASLNCTTFAANSLIIPMDTTYQNFGMFKAYGLVYTLLKNNVPVSWAIWPNQTSPWVPPAARTTDIILASGTDLKTGNALTTGFPNYNYAGGPFVIASADAAAATAVINSWWTAQGGSLPAVHKATASFEAVVNIKLTHAPLIASEQINASIAAAYFNAAGIPDSTGNAWKTTSCYSTAFPPVQTASPPSCNPDIFNEQRIANGDLFLANSCEVRKYDVFVTPHNSGYSYSLTDPTNLGTKTYANLDNFVNQGGGWVALCHSILSNENFIYDLLANGNPTVKALFKYIQDGNTVPSGFLTTSGFPSIANGGGTYSFEHPELPIGQVVPTPGIAQSLPGGSVQTWNHSLVTYLNGVERISYFQGSGVQYDHSVNGVYHGGAGRGKLTFIGGHSFSTTLPYSSNATGPYVRMFLDALFFNGAAVTKVTLTPSTTSVPQGYSTLTLAIKNTGSSDANVTVTQPLEVTLPPGVTYLGTSGAAPDSAPAAGSSAGSGCPAGGCVVHWNPGFSIPANSTYATVSIAVNYATSGSVNTVGLLAVSYGDPFSESFVARDCVQVTVAPTAGVAITKTLQTPDPHYPGSIVTWTINYSNPGSANLNLPSIDDVLPSQFQYVSASPAPNSVIPPGSSTKLHWDLGAAGGACGATRCLTPGAAGTITLRASIQTATGQPFTNTATMTGTDATSTSYTASSSSPVNVSTIEISGTKTVNTPGPVNPGTTLTYTISPSSSGPGLLDTVRVFDAPPLNMNTIGGITPNTGSFAAYPQLAAQDGTDAGPNPATNNHLAAGATPFTYALGATLTVTMTLTNNDPNNASGGNITNVTASLTPSDGASTCVPLAGQPASVAKGGGTATITFTCTVGSLGEIAWDGDASGTYADPTLGNVAYDFATATSPSILGVQTATGTNVVQWTPGVPNSNDDPVDVLSVGSQAGPGVMALEGGTAVWERYDIANNAWINGTNNLPAADGTGAALAYDGKGFTAGAVYALRGGTQTNFYKYALNATPAYGGAWTTLTSAPATIGAGGALVYLNNFVYALRGGTTTTFYRYDTAGNSWATMAAVPQAVAAGGALTTDGTNVYAFVGNNKKAFYRYNVAADTWTQLKNPTTAVKTGGALVYRSGLIYGFAGGGSNHFMRYTIATNAWVNVRNAPGGVNAGGALTTDGTSIWGARGGNQKTFWRYDSTANTWTTLANTNTNLNAGGALAWVPGNPAADSTSQTARAAPVLATSPATVTITQVITSTSTVNTVTPTLSRVVVNGAASNLANCTRTPSGTFNVTANVPATVTWTCTSVTGTNAFGAVTYSTGATGTTPATNWGTAQANSVLISPVLSFTAKVDSPTAATQVTNVGMISNQSGGTLSTVGTNAVTTTINQPAALAATKTNSPQGTVHPGDTITYTITVQNTTASQATNVVLTDVTPSGGTAPTTDYATGFANCTTTQGTCAGPAVGATGTVTYNLGNVAGYASVTMTLAVTVKSPASARTSASPTAIPNSASFTINGGASTATNTVTNYLVAPPLLSIAKAESNPTADANGFVNPTSTTTYTMVVTNAASNSVPATSVQVQDSVPAGTTYVSCAGGTSCSQSGGVVTWNVPTIVAGGTATVTMTVTVDRPAVYGGIVSNAAVVTATGLTDPIESNVVSYLLNATPNLTVVKSSCPGTAAVPAGGYAQVVPGATLTYRLRVKNLDPTATANIVGAFVHDAIPTGTTYVTGSTYLVDPADDIVCNAAGDWPVSGGTWIHIDDTPGSPALPTIASSMLVYSFAAQYRGDTPDGGILATGTNASNANDAIVQFRVTVNALDGGGNEVANGTALDNTATAGASSPIDASNDFSVNSSTLRHLIWNTPNLSATKSVSPAGTVSTGYDDPNDSTKTLPTELTYTIVVTNSGTKSVTFDLKDTLSPFLVYPSMHCDTSVNPTQCTGFTNYAAGSGPSGWDSSSRTITWPNITLAGGASTTLTFVANPYDNLPAGTYTFDNTALTTSWTHYASATDAGTTAPTQSNTVSTTLTVPTIVKLVSFAAQQNKNDVLLSWHSEYEIDNLGYNVYREQGGVRTRVNKKLIPGGALKGKNAPLSGYSYRLRDKVDSGAFVQYWLEDIDLHGVHTPHGPVTPVITSKPLDPGNAAPLPGLGPDGFTFENPAGIGVLQPAALPPATAQQKQAQLEIAADEGLKIYVKKEGWYRISRAQMAAAGWDPGSNGNKIALYCGGVEQPIVVKNGQFDLADTVEFYGLGVDTAATGARTYWLRSVNGGRLRYSSPGGKKQPSFSGNSVSFTTQRIDRLFFAAGILTGAPSDNWTGLLITGDGLLDRDWSPAAEELKVANVDPGGNATMEIVMQGATDGRHDVTVGVNGHSLGIATLQSLERKAFTYTFPASWLGGSAQLALTARNGEEDISTLYRTRLIYPHLLRADDGLFEASLPASSSVTVGGFPANAIRAIDVTDPLAPAAVDVTVGNDGSAFSATFSTPAGSGPRTMLVFATGRTLDAPEMGANRPSSYAAQASTISADMVIVTNSALATAANALKSVRDANGVATTVIDVEDIYDEANFGIRSPEAIRTFLQSTASWKRAPHFVTLIGDASFDPRDYLQMGSVDLLPAHFITTAYMKTVSDDWFTDFNDDGIADLPIGRIPVRTADEASAVVNKIVSRATAGAWSSRAVFIAGDNSTYDFEGSVAATAALVPAGVAKQQILIGRDGNARQSILNALSGGELLADYVGHGSVEIWGLDATFDSSAAGALTNGAQLPLVVAMTCLNGYFHDLYTESLAEALLKAPGGGAAAVWASSTLTTPDFQEQMNKELMRQLFGSSSLTIGEAVARAKKVVTDRDVRASWILFGDPSMKLRP